MAARHKALASMLAAPLRRWQCQQLRVWHRCALAVRRIAALHVKARTGLAMAAAQGAHHIALRLAIIAAFWRWPCAYVVKRGPNKAGSFWHGTVIALHFVYPLHWY